MNTAQLPILGHLQLAHHLWDLLLQPTDWAIDATCGNGHDALFLSKRTSKLFCMDIQPAAIETTRLKVPSAEMYLGCHSQLPEEAFKPNLKLITYNLGYLPGGDKTLTTKLDTTLESLKKALDLMPVGAAVSITFYPGHNEGLNEMEKITPFIKDLNSKSFTVSTHEWINRNKAPVLSLILKTN